MVRASIPAELAKLMECLQIERLKRGLTKRTVAKLFKVGIDTVIDWEYGRKPPPAKYAKAIIDFLGYIPFCQVNPTLGKQLYHARLVNGKTQKQLAKIIGCDTETITRIESGNINIQDKTRIKIEKYLIDICTYRKN